MDVYSSQITTLVEQLSRLPGIGAKSAQRLAFHILNMPEDQVASLSQAMTNAKKNVHYCKECCTYTDQELCPICASDQRNHRVIMVVENPRDLAAYEKMETEAGYLKKLSPFMVQVLQYAARYGKLNEELTMRIGHLSEYVKNFQPVIYRLLVKCYEAYPGNDLVDHICKYIMKRSEERRVGKECRSRWSPYH